jgi:hypothetical protein
MKFNNRTKKSKENLENTLGEREPLNNRSKKSKENLENTLGEREPLRV